jgi:hypothetical protein
LSFQRATWSRGAQIKIRLATKMAAIAAAKGKGR